MNGYSWYNISADFYAKQRMTNLSEPIDKTLPEGWHTDLTVSELYKGFAVFSDRYGLYTVQGRCSSELRLGEKVDGMVKGVGDCELLLDKMGRHWINLIPQQDLIGPYKTIQDAKSAIKAKKLTEYKRALVFYKIKDVPDESICSFKTSTQQPTHPPY